jgi:hypothetical protein
LAGGVALVSAALGWLLGPIAVLLPVGIAVLALGAGRRQSPTGVDSDEPLRAHIARARRRDEACDVMVVRVVDGSPEVAHRLKRCLRVTDSACVLRHDGVPELVAMVDRDRLDRGSLEDRLGALASRRIRIGWARFPEDAWTVPALLHEARRRSEHDLDLARATPVVIALAERAG